MDEEGCFSATLECIAKHQAFRRGSGVIVDCFTGVVGMQSDLQQDATVLEIVNKILYAIEVLGKHSSRFKKFKISNDVNFPWLKDVEVTLTQHIIHLYQYPIFHLS